MEKARQSINIVQSSIGSLMTKMQTLNAQGNGEQVEIIRAGRIIKPAGNTRRKDKLPETRGELGFQNKTGSHKTT